MKKLFVAATSALMLIGLAACGGKKKTDPTPKPSPSGQPTQSASGDPVEKFSDKVLDNGDKFGIAGPGQVYVDGVKNPTPWGAANGSFGMATAVSLRDVARKDIELAGRLEKMDITGLFMLEKVELGWREIAGYTEGGYDAKGNFIEVDGVYTAKFGKMDYDDETETYFIDSWIPSAEVYIDSLTPDTYHAPLHSDQKDEHGLDHNSNPMVLKGAGTYTYFVAVYKNVNEAGSYYGIGAHLDEAKEEVVPAAEPAPYYVGAVSGWKFVDWGNTDENLEAFFLEGSGNQWTIELTIEDPEASNGRIIDANHGGATLANFSNVTVGAELVKSDGGDDNNFQFLAAGSYELTLKLVEAGNQLEIAELK